jgi:hypothetical protein
VSRHKSNQLTKARPNSVRTPSPADLPPELGGPEPQRRWLTALVGLGFVAVIALIVFVWMDAADVTPNDGGPAPPRAWVPVTAEDRICDDFMQKRKTGDPAAAGLLAPAPVVGQNPVSPAAAERIETDVFLHDPDLKVIDIRRTAENGYVFVTQGNVAAPRLEVQGADGKVRSEQRTMSNPDLHVEVLGGRIHGVRAELHHDVSRTARR